MRSRLCSRVCTSASHMRCVLNHFHARAWRSGSVATPAPEPALVTPAPRHLIGHFTGLLFAVPIPTSPSTCRHMGCTQATHSYDKITDDDALVCDAVIGSDGSPRNVSMPHAAAFTIDSTSQHATASKVVARALHWLETMGGIPRLATVQLGNLLPSVRKNRHVLRDGGRPAAAPRKFDVRFVRLLSLEEILSPEWQLVEHAKTLRAASFESVVCVALACGTALAMALMLIRLSLRSGSERTAWRSRSCIMLLLLSQAVNFVPMAEATRAASVPPPDWAAADAAAAKPADAKPPIVASGLSASGDPSYAPALEPKRALATLAPSVAEAAIDVGGVGSPSSAAATVFEREDVPASMTAISAELPITSGGQHAVARPRRLVVRQLAVTVSTMDELRTQLLAQTPEIEMAAGLYRLHDGTIAEASRNSCKRYNQDNGELCGYYLEICERSIQLHIHHDVVIRAAAGATVVIDAQAAPTPGPSWSIRPSRTTIFNITGGTVTLSGLEMTNGYCGSQGFSHQEGGDGGAAVRIDIKTNRTKSVVTFESCKFYGNLCRSTAGHAAGVMVTGGTVFFKNCDIEDNEGNGVFIANRWPFHGLEESIAHFQNCNIRNNLGKGVFLGGSGLHADFPSIVHIKNCEIYGNRDNGIDGLGQHLGASNEIHLDSVSFGNNVCPELSLGESTGSSSTFFNLTFLPRADGCLYSREHPRATIESAVKMACPIGGYMLQGPVSYSGATEFSGCQFACPAGTFGNTSSVTDATCSGPCPDGHYCPEGTIDPIPCPAGTHGLQGAQGTSEESCLPCTPGTFNGIPGFVGETCTPCLAGSYSASLESLTCAACSTGSYASANGAPTCTSCPSFSTTASTGATSINDCRCVKGYFFSVDATGASVCSACPEGSTTGTSGATSVSDCDCGNGFPYLDGDVYKCCPTFSTSSVADASGTSLDVCRCQKDYYLDAANTVCTGCPAFSATSSAGATSVEACSECQYGSEGGSCVDCVTAFGVGIDCTMPGLTVATLPVRVNHWRVSPSSIAIGKCKTDGVCIGATASQVRNDTAGRRLQSAAVLDSSSTYGDGLCRDGHTGAFCEVRDTLGCVARLTSLPSSTRLRTHSQVCKANWFRGVDGKCLDCAESDGNLVLTIALPIALAVVLVIAALFMLCRDRSATIEELLSGDLSTSTFEAKLEGKTKRAVEQLRGVKGAKSAAKGRLAGMTVTHGPSPFMFSLRPCPLHSCPPHACLPRVWHLPYAPSLTGTR